MTGEQPLSSCPALPIITGSLPDFYIQVKECKYNVMVFDYRRCIGAITRICFSEDCGFTPLRVINCILCIVNTTTLARHVYFIPDRVDPTRITLKNLQATYEVIHI